MLKLRLLKWILIGAAALQPSGAEAQSPGFSKLFVDADSLLQSKQYDDALVAFTKALSRALSKGELALALWRIGQVQHALGREDLYIQNLTDSVKAMEIDEVRKELTEAQANTSVAITSAEATRDFIIRTGKVDLPVLFVPGGSELTDQGLRQTTALAQALQSDPLLANRFLVVGHTDTTGSAELNLKLSKARARKVLQKLIELGVAPERLSSEGRGKTEPKAAPERTAEDRAKNRRVEVRKIA